MIHVLLTGLPLVAGLALALLASRRRWAPPLPVALLVGAVLRLTILLIAARDDWQPYDLAEDFRSTADTVLDGRDPVLHLREGGWHFLPFLAYVLAGQRELGLALGVPWSVVGRLVPVLADLALIPVVGRLATDATPRRQALRGFQYGCAPLGVMVSAIHGQFAPITLLLGMLALLAARDRRPHVAGMLLGLSVTSASWSVLVVPGVLLASPVVRQRLVVLGWTVVVPVAFLLSSAVFLGTPLDRLAATANASLSARPVVGDWGWSALVTGGEQVVSASYGRVGTPLLAIGLVAATWAWRKADPVSLTLALLLVFLIVTYRFGAQYLAWPVPYLIARSARGAWPAITAAGVWAGFGYLYMTRLDTPGWQQAHTWWALSSLAIIAFFVHALPPRHSATRCSAARAGQLDGPGAAAQSPPGTQ